MTYTAQHKLFTVMLVSTQAWKVNMLIFFIDNAIVLIIIVFTIATHVILIFFQRLSYSSILLIVNWRNLQATVDLPWEMQVFMKGPLWTFWYKSVCAKLGEHCTAK